MNKSTNEKAQDVLVVEDNLGDIGLIREAFELNNIPNPIKVVHDGVEALSYLRREGPYADQARPGIIILDLNLPRKDGREVLVEIKTHPDFRQIPVLVLTSSKAVGDIQKSYDLHANCYMTKPVDLEEFMRIIRSAAEFWLTAVRLPT